MVEEKTKQEYADEILGLYRLLLLQAQVADWHKIGSHTDFSYLERHIVGVEQKIEEQDVLHLSSLLDHIRIRNRILRGEILAHIQRKHPEVSRQTHDG